jgi:hypothetical protein
VYLCSDGREGILHFLNSLGQEEKEESDRHGTSECVQGTVLVRKVFANEC